MILLLLICCIILFFIGIGIFDESDDLEVLRGLLATLSFIIAVILFAVGVFHGFINHPKTEGTHQGEVMAVDLEGIHFRHYDIYLKTSAYTDQDDEIKYCIYDYEEDLKNQLNDAIGKKVKLHFGHDGGYIGWKSCGSYHIKSVEVLEDDEDDKEGNIS